ncbi:uncharacterized protein KY384_002839 [Bacidia gigantensis]|uniref:uncharacterized protein n=1 Tax=Bacidia gigantensis TaxID=2732470 RepID=UPI001D03A737|nr:uncharacterized protein KY384_002839 [Bacidia gigantensis]KAG8532354.1 hypothetical protein KY384_002839 [Bacidia gigantensis]
MAFSVHYRNLALLTALKTGQEPVRLELPSSADTDHLCRTPPCRTKIHYGSGTKMPALFGNSFWAKTVLNEDSVEPRNPLRRERAVYSLPTTPEKPAQKPIEPDAEAIENTIDEQDDHIGAQEDHVNARSKEDTESVLGQEYGAPALTTSPTPDHAPTSSPLVTKDDKPLPLGFRDLKRKHDSNSKSKDMPERTLAKVHQAPTLLHLINTEHKSSPERLRELMRKRMSKSKSKNTIVYSSRHVGTKRQKRASTPAQQLPVDYPPAASPPATIPPKSPPPTNTLPTPPTSSPPHHLSTPSPTNPSSTTTIPTTDCPPTTTPPAPKCEEPLRPLTIHDIQTMAEWPIHSYTRSEDLSRDPGSVLVKWEDMLITREAWDFVAGTTSPAKILHQSSLMIAKVKRTAACLGATGHTMITKRLLPLVKIATEFLLSKRKVESNQGIMQPNFNGD